ncbi:MAG: DUF262 domain-containing protein [Pseudodonghicola sp.]
MEIDVEFGDEDIVEDEPQGQMQDPDEFLAKNSFRIVYQTNNFFLPQIRDMIEKREAINLRPEYQRRLRWTNAQKSKLIESLLLNIPVPPVFFYEADAARYEVMDGQQRLNAIRDFFAGDFALSGLKVLKPLNGLRYTKCPPRVKRTLDRATISAIVLLMESEAERPSAGQFTITDIRRLVFDRLNTGGRQLNAQEIRNALNPGALNRCIINLSRHERFTEVFGIPAYTEDDEEDYYENPKRQKNILYASMRDCELVLRFFALREPDNIRGSMKSMLDRAMEVDLTEEQAEELAVDFIDRFQFLYELFDGAPFKIASTTDEREKVSAALYDASMVALDKVWADREKIIDDREGVSQRLKNAIGDDESYELIVGRRNTADSVKKRINLLREILLPE